MSPERKIFKHNLYLSCLKTKISCCFIVIEFISMQLSEKHLMYFNVYLVFKFKTKTLNTLNIRKKTNMITTLEVLNNKIKQTENESYEYCRGKLSLFHLLLFYFLQMWLSTKKTRVRKIIRIESTKSWVQKTAKINSLCLYQ